jgi:oxidoreductase AflX
MAMSYAILGATGNVGGSILKILLKQPDNEIHCLVRSPAKLYKLNPEVKNNPKVHIHGGDINNIEVLTQCITCVHAVFLTVAATANQPGCTIAQQTARAFLEALKRIRDQDPNRRLPRLVVLSSASLDHHLCRDLPPFFHSIMNMAASYIYDDLREAEKVLRAQDDWAKTVFIKPGALVHDEQKGHQLSLDRQQTFLSLLDLAAGMIEVADGENDYWDGKNVSVVPTAKDVKIEWKVPIFIFMGLLFYFFPGLWPYLGELSEARWAVVRSP